MTRRRSPRLGVLASLVALLIGGACDDDPTAPELGATLEVSFQRLRAVPPEVGTLELWVRARGDTVSVGRLPAGAGTVGSIRFQTPLDRPEGVLVTLEPPGDNDDRPSAARLLDGAFQGLAARLTIDGVVTDGRPLETDPGAHSLFTTSNNDQGYPSAESAGLWLFTLTPSRNEHGTREVKLTPLRSGWVYEGWIVHQSDPRVWISYGKFRPDELSLLTSRDDTGTGPFSGPEDFRNAGVEDVPGEEWTTDRVARGLGIELPGGFALPLTLDTVDGEGRARWHHVITVEPAWELTEGPVEGSPFGLRPYENSIGAGGPGDPRTIVLAHPPPTAEVVRLQSP